MNTRAPILLSLCLLLSVLAWSASADKDQPLRVASKMFTESYVLGEITAQLLEADGFEVERKLGLGGTLIAFGALQGGEIDVYPEYTGTLIEAVLRTPNLSDAELTRQLEEKGLRMQAMLGFNNSYAIALHRELATSRGITRISDLAAHADLKAGFTHEFLNRGDGWPALSAAYQLPQKPSGIEHALAYPAIENGHLDITDAYTTDGELNTYDLTLLTDDLAFFPQYQAVLLTRTDLPEAVARSLQKLGHALDEDSMRRLNHRVANDGESPAAVAAAFLSERGLAEANANKPPSRTQRIVSNTLVHLKLTGIALLLACALALPTALFASRFDRLARGLLYVTGLIQTIPALALLALLIPLVGLGERPAIIALLAYSLLPIVRNTITGLFSIDPLLREVATGMGMPARQRLWRIEIPLAMPTILAGIKTAAIISIGTATLAAFVGAGGLGEPIITGLNLNDHRLILEGAIPAALLAITAELVFEFIERLLIPAHLRR
ncbi:MAG: glycine betaine ABC transporter substrate-binding protein [Halioglobus sp.]